MKTRFLEIADLELADAIRYYEQERVGLGAEFHEEVNEALDRIEQMPFAWSRLGKDIRVCRTKRFPYGLVYQIRGNEAVIVAVMHLHRRPGYWRNRLKNGG
ncbi:MAG: type II toxin-antitoxin system RelE/ParE family toxin [Planctomycetales bacterium]|nr:type II toxin-antitoxin system RelE/ParE family toxin [Planctomycetales bacterium]